MFFRAAVLLAASCLGQPLGSWKLNAARSTFAGEIRPKSLTLRIEVRAKGEVVTFDRTEVTGRTTVSSMILYLDGVARDFQQDQCFGTQSSRRIDSETIEILRNGGLSAWIRFIRRTASKRNSFWRFPNNALRVAGSIADWYLNANKEERICQQLIGLRQVSKWRGPIAGLF